VTGLSAVLDLAWPLVDHPHRRQPPAALHALQAPATTPSTRRARQGDCRVIDRLVDRLLAQPATWLVGEQHTELVRDLLRAPAPCQQPLDDLGQHLIAGDPPRARLARPAPGGVFGVMRPVAAVWVAVAPDLATDRRRRTAKLLGDPTHRRLRRQQVRDPDPFLL